MPENFRRRGSLVKLRTFLRRLQLVVDKVDIKSEMLEEPILRNPVSEFIHVFPNGQEFRVERRPDDSFRIFLKAGNKVGFDFDELLPTGYKFVSEEYIEALDEPDTFWRPWFTDYRRKEIYVGDFESSKDILGLLHEIGH